MRLSRGGANITATLNVTVLANSQPQMNEVAQGASMAEGLPAGLIVCVTADGNREGPLAKEGLVSSWHGS